MKMNEPSGTEHSNLDTPPHPPRAVTHMLCHKWAPVGVGEALSEKRDCTFNIKLEIGLSSL